MVGNIWPDGGVIYGWMNQRWSHIYGGVIYGGQYMATWWSNIWQMNQWINGGVIYG